MYQRPQWILGAQKQKGWEPQPIVESIDDVMSRKIFDPPVVFDSASDFLGNDYFPLFHSIELRCVTLIHKTKRN
jgi:hypothetical protein